MILNLAMFLSRVDELISKTFKMKHNHSFVTKKNFSLRNKTARISERGSECSDCTLRTAKMFLKN